LRAFGSASGVRRASEEQLAAVRGVTPALANKIKEALNVE
jgi:excinuclease UvrABC nuclease subunit